jgi:hypothetical protein
LKLQIADAQKRYTESANARRAAPPPLGIGDEVLVSAEHIRTTQPTRKLAARYLGPFKIIAQPSAQSYTIQLPDYLRAVHPVFHVSQLEPHPPDEFPGRKQDPPEPVVVDGETEYEIAEVVDSKLDRRFRTCPLRYTVRWLGYEGTDEEFSLLAASELAHAPELVRDYHAAHPNKPGNFADFQRYAQLT